MNDEEIKVSELDLASEIRDTDQIMIVQGGANKKVLGSYINEHGVTVSSTAPDTSQRVWFKKSKNLFSSLLELGTYSNEGVKSASTTNYRNSTPIAVQPNTTYTFSINGVSQKYGIYYYNNTNTFINSEGLTTGTFTTPANCYYINFRCFDADFTSDYANLKLQIELGNTATAYEPYITPRININGENLFYANDYSTAEQVIGTWLGKPLYRKTINFGALPNNSSKQVAIDVTNFDKLVNLYGVAYSTGYTMLIPFIHNDLSNIVNVYFNNGTKEIGVATHSDRSGYTESYITIEYTKTTD